VDATGRHGVFLAQFPPTQVEQFLVAMDVLEEKRRSFPAPVRERQGPPAASFADDDVTRFHLRFVAVRDVAEHPPRGPLP
jgi:hypothetical protein